MQRPFVDALPRSRTLFCWWDVSVILPSSSFYTQTQHYYCTTQHTTRAKEVLPNKNHARNAHHTSPVHSHHPGSDTMVPSAAAWRYLQRTHYNAFTMGRKFVHGDLNLDLWPWHSNSSKRGTKHICEFGPNPFSSSRDISYTNKQEKSRTAPRTEPYTVHCMR